ncbi:uncharacterized protein LDX57_010559 [Aspergillus melleus]|uniref:uncharacterized protein n=1 Tax=Aspergillus melleus TaxID=138277 RepID=UPI001E8D0FA5|nr:uncharacterized protein LDX57_010559 [Aspergillus melleus]KAH8432926.1 hypothetical protein LDX57_010559 [Aspergillus melleus]
MEAAGLALAILPLLVNQLDNYVQGLQTVKGFRAKRYRQQLDSYFSNIGTQHVIFSNTLERALDGVVDYQDGIDELINNPSGEAWKKPELVKKMEEKLERNYFPFKKTMTELAALLQDLSRRLKFENISSAEKAWEDASTLEREVRKFRDIFSKSIYADILDRISVANAILDTLVKQSEYLNQPQRRRISKRHLLRYRKVRKSAGSLHYTLIRGKCWKCPCKASHQVHLILRHPDMELADASTEGHSANPRFNLVLMSASDAGPRSSLSKSYRLEAESEIIHSSLGVRDVCLGGHVGNRTPDIAPNRHKKAVQFSLPTGNSSSLACLKVQPPPIFDICATLSAMTTEEKGQRALGWLYDESHRHNITVLQTGLAYSKPQSLQDLVTASARFLKGQPDEGFLFSQLDRLRVAVILSCSVFQFHGSWLRHDWRSRDIMFCPQDRDATGYFYISCNIEDNTDGLNMFDCQNAPTLIRNLVLFPLGLVLVELSLCQNLESMREHDDTDHNQAHANLKTATRLLPQVEQRSGPEYAEVVDRCLSWHDRKETSLDSEKLQEEVFQLIISPLVKNLKSFEEYLEVDEV